MHVAMPGDPEIDGLLDGQQDVAGVSIVSLAATLTFYEVGVAPSGAARAGGDALGSPFAEKQSAAMSRADDLDSRDLSLEIRPDGDASADHNACQVSGPTSRETIGGGQSGLIPSEADGASLYGQALVTPSSAANNAIGFLNPAGPDAAMAPQSEPHFVEDTDDTSLAADSNAASLGTIAQLADYLVNGYWGGSGHHWASHTISVNITDLTAAEKTLAVSALNAYHEVCNVSFTFTSGAADITYNNNGNRIASTGASWNGSAMTSATIDISSNWWPNDNLYSHMYQTYLHETGHADRKSTRLNSSH